MTLSAPRIVLLAGLAALFVTVGFVASPAPSDATDGSVDPDAPLRVCVLDDDMPLSHQGPDEASGRKGLYLDLAEEMAASTDASMTAHFAVTAFYKRPVREGLLAKQCDAFFGLPRTEGPWFIRGKVALSKAFTSVGYALVTPKGTPVTALSDLKGKTVGVQGGSPGALAVALEEGVEPYTVRFPEPALDALYRGEIDAALVWGPRAGYLNKYVYQGAFDVHPTSLTWPVAIGVRAEDHDRIGALDALIERFAARTVALRSEYGFPDASPVTVTIPGVGDDDEGGEGETTGDARRPPSTTPSAVPALAPSTASSAVQGIGKSAENVISSGVEATLLQHVRYATIPTDSIQGDPEAGQKMFNAIYGCAHCHGTNAEGATAPTDLRKLEERYGDEAEKVFEETVRNGRDGTAMPPWKTVISDEKIQDIKAFIFSIQEDA